MVTPLQQFNGPHEDKWDIAFHMPLYNDHEGNIWRHELE